MMSDPELAVLADRILNGEVESSLGLTMNRMAEVFVGLSLLAPEARNKMHSTVGAIYADKVDGAPFGFYNQKVYFTFKMLTFTETDRLKEIIERKMQGNTKMVLGCK